MHCLQTERDDSMSENVKGQYSFIDIIMSSNDNYKDLSSDELEKAIRKLQEAKNLAKERETEERARREKEERERKEQEESALQERHVQEVTSMDLPLDWSNFFDGDERTRGVHIESIPDALVHCLTTLGQVDIEYISSITGEDYKTVIQTLKGSIFQNPDKWGECFFKGWETSEEYLSGNLMRKWKAAKEANKEYGGYFEDNIKAIEKILPPTVATKDIYITLGSPWVPADIIDDFIEYLFGEPLAYSMYYGDKKSFMDSLKVRHDEITGTWEIPHKS